jgi:hypothetical protein
MATPRKKEKQKMTIPTTQPTQEADSYELAYRIFADHGHGDPPVEIPMGKSTSNANSFMAVTHLRTARLRIRDSPIDPDNLVVETGGELPYRNTYGPLTDDPYDKWDYRFRDPSDGVEKSVWLEKFGPRVGFLDEAEFGAWVVVSEIPQRAWELKGAFVGSEGEAGRETSGTKGTEEWSETARFGFL